MAAVRRAWCNTGPAFFRAVTSAACRPARAGPCCTTRTASSSARACVWWGMHCSATLLARWTFTCARPKSHRPGGPEPTQSLAAHGDWPAAAARTRRGRSVQDGVVPPLAHAGLHAAVFNVVGSSAHSGSAAALADGLDDPNVCFRACNPGARVTARGRQCPFDVVRSGRSTGLWYRQASRTASIFAWASRSNSNAVHAATARSGFSACATARARGPRRPRPPSGCSRAA